MRAINRVLAVSLFGLSFLSAGCVVRSYPLVKDRVDQDLNSGNRGYLQGNAPSTAAEKERPATRRTQVVEIELHSPLKFESMSKYKKSEARPQEAPAAAEDTYTGGNRGYLTQSENPQALEAGSLQQYTVQKGDTLQKISKKFYGTTKKWNKIYQANSGTLKGPNKLYPGQVINIPVESKSALQEEPVQNLK